MTGNWRPITLLVWWCSVLFLEGLRLGLRPWGQPNGARITADHVPTAAATQVGGL